MGVELLDKDFRQCAYAGLASWIADIDDAPTAASVLVFDDAEEAFHAVLDIGEASLLFAAVNK